ncbi:hypothetical protein Geob_2590 [Geotalea daltonii FRC-32]|uniref:Helix-turn-helix domain-containing protein n=1 Tax=Geotalea daltonii (strain DSM 22248 / JCM 15807 / FRC-32) TaxID=316067 RepID=B9M0T7_GEODF|nr:hypothetical protein [Geotalea daltonii]ACM20940.1 hypothetical protein Geob_2590 [Geotalea daltonii FRC-32]
MAKIIDETSFITAEEAADRLGTTNVQVLMLMRNKSLTGRLSEGEWLVTSESVARWQAAAPEERQLKICTGSCTGCSCS